LKASRVCNSTLTGKSQYDENYGSTQMATDELAQSAEFEEQSADYGQYGFDDDWASAAPA
jgi:hypothetical protein